jgi:hypothetical protein
MEESKKNQNKIVKDVPRLENDIYRLSAWKGKEGTFFVSLQVYFKKNGSFKRTEEGINVISSVRRELAKAMLVAKNDSELPLPAEGKKFEARFVTSVPVGEGKEFQVSKVRGSKYSSVRICFASKGPEGDLIPSPKRSLSIFESSVEGVAEALMSSEMDEACAELQEKTA